MSAVKREMGAGKSTEFLLTCGHDGGIPKEQDTSRQVYAEAPLAGGGSGEHKDAPVYLAPTKATGVGVFASTDFAKGAEILLEEQFVAPMVDWDTDSALDRMATLLLSSGVTKDDFSYAEKEAQEASQLVSNCVWSHQYRTNWGIARAQAARNHSRGMGSILMGVVTCRINHTCAAPNVVCRPNASVTAVCLVALRDIKAGEELLHNYTPESVFLPRSLRMERLALIHGFKCVCTRCLDDKDPLEPAAQDEVVKFADWVRASWKATDAVYADQEQQLQIIALLVGAGSVQFPDATHWFRMALRAHLRIAGLAWLFDDAEWRLHAEVAKRYPVSRDLS